MTFITFKADEDQINKMAEMFDASPKQIDKALTRSINKTLVWVKNRIASDISRESKMALKAIRHRFFLSKSKRNAKGMLADLWIGTRPMKAAYIGSLRQMKRGAKSGKHFFQGSFVATMKSGHKSVWYSTGDSRQIKEEEVDVEGVEEAVKRWEPKLMEQVIKTLDNELNFEVFLKNV